MSMSLQAVSEPMAAELPTPLGQPLVKGLLEVGRREVLAGTTVDVEVHWQSEAGS